MRVRKAGSGSKGSDFADRVSGDWLLEEKETVRDSIPLREWWKKVEYEAARRGKHPAVVLSLKTIGRADVCGLAILPVQVFYSLLRRLQDQ